MTSDNPIWKEAEAIYQRWASEEFDIDDEKASNLTYTYGYSQDNYLDPKSKSARRSTITDMFAMAISNWPAKREMSAEYWITPGRDLIQAYALARIRHCLIAGPAIKKELQETEHRLVQLDSELRETKGQLGKMEMRFHKANDALINIDNQLAEAKGELSVIRIEDIRRSLNENIEHSKVEPSDEDEEKSDER